MIIIGHCFGGGGGNATEEEYDMTEEEEEDGNGRLGRRRVGVGDCGS